MMRSHFAARLLVLLLTVISWKAIARGDGSSSIARQLRSGDIVFQCIPCGDLCTAIVETTPCAREHPFNHCGIVVRNGDSVSVIEAIGKDVHATPLISFLKRDTAIQLFVGRPLKAAGVDTYDALRKAIALQGRPYDDAFMPGDSALYCSELVYACYLRKGKPAFALAPMTFKSPHSGETFPAWIAYYSALGRPVPEGLPGINPCAIARSPLIELLVFNKKQAGRGLQGLIQGNIRQ